MKIFFTSFLCLIACIGSIHSQVTFDRDTAYVQLIQGEDTKGNILVTNTNSRDVEVSWRVLENSLNNDWLLGFCDFYTCNYNDFAPLPQVSNCDAPVCYLTAGYSANWYLQADPDVAGGASAVWRVEVTTSSSDVDTLTWITQDFTGVETLTNVVDEYFAFPIPANDVLNIHLLTKVSGQLSANIIDLSGKLLKKIQLNQVDETIQVSDLSSGVYILSIVDSQGRSLVQQQWTKY